MFQQQSGGESLSVATTQAGALGAIGSWFLTSEAGILAGIVIGVAGLLMQRHYHRKRDRREQAEHDARMREHEARMRGEIK